MVGRAGKLGRVILVLVCGFGGFDFSFVCFVFELVFLFISFLSACGKATSSWR